MNYTQTLEFLFQSLPAFETSGAMAYKPGLERISAFCRHLHAGIDIDADHGVHFSVAVRISSSGDCHHTEAKSTPNWNV